MTCEEIKISLHEYVDQQLNDQMKKEVAQHLRTCENCLAEYKKLMKFFLYLKEIPAVLDPPKNIMDLIRNELINKSSAMHKSEQTSRSEKDKRGENPPTKEKANERNRDGRKGRPDNIPNLLQIKHLFSNKEFVKTLLVMLPLFLIALAYLIYDLGKHNYPWKIRNVNGVVQIEGSAVSTDKWNQGETLSTEENSSVTVLIPKVGVVNVGPNTVMRLVKGKDGANKINMNRGEISVVNSADMPDLIVEVGNARAVDRGGEFSIVSENYGEALISVKYGFVEIEYNGEVYYLDENYSSRIKNGFKPGVPVHNDASDSLKKAVDSFDYGNGGETSVEKIIGSAKEKDVLTLLALIPKVQQLQRQILFQEISNRFPPPENVTRAGILRLEKEMLYNWWLEIEWQI